MSTPPTTAMQQAPRAPKRRRKAPARDRVVELVRVRAGDLQANPSNWRRHPERQRAALRSLLADIGYADALLARRDGERLVLVDGHLRRSLDPEQVVPVLVLDVTEAEADTLLATLDPLAALATPDPAALSSLLERVHTSGAAVLELLQGLRRAAGLPLRAVLADPEGVPDLPEAPRTERGEVWVVGGHRVACGDATSALDVARLMGGATAEVLWTDPPYGVDYVGKTPRRLRIEGDSPAGLQELLRGAFAQIDAVLAEGAALYVAHPAGPASATFLQAFLEVGWVLRQTLVWVKDAMVLGHGDYHYRHEPVLYGYRPGGGRRGRGARGWYGGNAKDSVFEVPRPRACTEHPTAKPVELIRRMLANSSRQGQVVLDPFCGSGSALVACELMGRRGYGMDVDPRYCDVAIERLERATGETARKEEGS